MADTPTIAPSAIMRDIVDLMIKGNSLPAIHDYIASQGGDPARDIANAHEYFAAVAVRSKPQAVIGMVMEGYRDIYRQALTVGDLPTARGCLKDLQALAIKMAEYDMEEPQEAQERGKERKRGRKAGAGTGKVRGNGRGGRAQTL